MLLLSRDEQSFECGHVPLDPFGIAGGLEPELASWRTDRADTRRGLELIGKLTSLVVCPHSTGTHIAS
jgi:hypothetical protein